MEVAILIALVLMIVCQLAIALSLIILIAQFSDATKGLRQLAAICGGDDDDDE